jgi:SAM-dependent methyltransferase
MRRGEVVDPSRYNGWCIMIRSPMRTLRTDIEVLDELVELNGKDVLDVGAGDGGFLASLRSRGARAVGLEVTPREGMLLGTADKIPLPDASLDAALMMRSLHHVPAAEHQPALAELRRVLRPTGLLYIAEPLPEGEFFQLTLPVDDETDVRAQAQQTIVHARGYVRELTYEYDAPLKLTFDRFAAMLLGADPTRERRFAEHEAALRQTFGPGERQFRSPMRADLLRASPPMA